MWETEAHQLRTQLVDEFLAWSAGKNKNCQRKNLKNGYGLYAIRPQIIAAPVTISTRSAPAIDEIYQLNDVVDLSTQKPDLVADALVADEPESAQLVSDDLSMASELGSPDAAPPEKTISTTTNNLSSQHMQDQHVMVNHLDVDSDEFRIAVHVPRQMDRMLDSAIFMAN